MFPQSNQRQSVRFSPLSRLATKCFNAWTENHMMGLSILHFVAYKFNAPLFIGRLAGKGPHSIWLNYCHRAPWPGRKLHKAVALPALGFRGSSVLYPPKRKRQHSARGPWVNGKCAGSWPQEDSGRIPKNPPRVGGVQSANFKAPRAQDTTNSIKSLRRARRKLGPKGPGGR